MSGDFEVHGIGTGEKLKALEEVVKTAREYLDDAARGLLLWKEAPVTVGPVTVTQEGLERQAKEDLARLDAALAMKVHPK